MARLVAMILSQDDAFHAQIAALLRGGPVPITVSAEGPGARKADLFIIDGRNDPSGAMGRIEALRGASTTAGVFLVASEPKPDLILHAMRAGANEFFTFPPAEDSFREALRRTAARHTASGQGRSASSYV